eukprot:GHVO01029408.1.p1 GENE.GHVO01029408.1~~GHVO01029408.1.p1  ORF type:complete len:472 (+),score=92.19 GHVO01029408.1:156-1418(+)
MVTVKAFQFFKNSAEALENLNAISDGKATELLASFIDLNVPKKKKKFTLGVIDAGLGKELSVNYGYKVVYDKSILELWRGCHMHMDKLVKQLDTSQLHKFEVSLGHGFSREKVQFDPARQDKPIQHAVALVDSLEKNINTFSMRIKEWYSWHFPELAKIVTDNVKYAEVVRYIKMKENFDKDEHFSGLCDITGDEGVGSEIVLALNQSMGQEVCESDMQNMLSFADQIIKLAEQKKHLSTYLHERLASVSPNLQALLGDILAGRLISHAGSLSNLAKYPSSTIQILGAEKALFHALKKRTNTPKYGLLFASSYISKAAPKDKGRISRSLANKSSIASRLDAYSVTPLNTFGTVLKEQLEERLAFLADGTVPRRNLTCMEKALEEYKIAIKKDKKEKKRKRKSEDVAIVSETEKNKKLKVE